MEIQARERKHLIAYMFRQTADCHGPLAAWLVRRELAYYDGPGRTWDCELHPYAASRDAACWQLGRSEADLHDFLAAMEEVASGLNQRKAR